VVLRSLAALAARLEALELRQNQPMQITADQRGSAKVLEH